MGIRNSVTLCALVAGLAACTVDKNQKPRRDSTRYVSPQTTALIPPVQNTVTKDAPTPAGAPPRVANRSLQSTVYNSSIPLRQLVDAYIREHGSQHLERKIVVRKEAHVLGVYLGEELLKEYRAALGHNYFGFDSTGDKEYEGDGRTPEGEFYVVSKIPQARYYKALLLSYPDASDARRGLESEMITPEQHDQIVAANRSCGRPLQNTGLGGWIELHGRNQPGIGDWTVGCIAVTNEEMDEIYAFSRTGCSSPGNPRTKIVITP